jgi:hypothetical protein
MAYIFVSDGRPEADEYASNRIWFDEKDPADLRRAQLEAQRRREYLSRRARPAQPEDPSER